MKLRKAPIDSHTLQRLDHSLSEDLLTENYSADEIAQQLSALGGDPDAIGSRGKELANRLLDDARLRPSLEERSSMSHSLLASPFGGVSVSTQKSESYASAAKRDFAMRQLLRAHRAGIVTDDAFLIEMRNHEAGATDRSDSTFRAFGKIYTSEREAVMKFLEAVAPAEAAGGEAIREWLRICQVDCIKGGLKMVAERETYHGRAFAERLIELGGTLPANVNTEIRESIDYVRDANLSDLEKLQRGASRYPNPEEIMQPLFEFANLLKEDQQTKEMVKLFAQDELSTLRWQNTLCAVLTELRKNGQLSVIA